MVWLTSGTRWTRKSASLMRAKRLVSSRPETVGASLIWYRIPSSLLGGCGSTSAHLTRSTSQSSSMAITSTKACTQRDHH